MSKKYRIQLGFELEFLTRYSENNFKYFCRNLLGNKAIEKYDYDTSVLPRTNDAEINLLNEMELVTNIWPEKEALENLQKLFNLLIAFECKTNSSCGLHFGVSFSSYNIQKQFSPLAFLINMKNDAEMAGIFGRKNNSFCRPFKSSSFWKIVKFCRHEQPEYINHESICSAICEIGKYNTFNFRTFDNVYIGHSEEFVNKNGPYVECRLMGGVNYHKRFNEIQHNIQNVILPAFRRSVGITNREESIINSLKNKDFKPLVSALGLSYRCFK